MIELDRREAARFRAAVRRCAGRPRGLGPPVALRQDEDGLTLSAALEEAAISLRLPTPGGAAACLVIPFATLAAIAGPGGGAAVFEAGERGRVHCRWQDRGEPRELDFEPVPPEARSADLAPAGGLKAAAPSLLAALHACGRTAGRGPGGRLALSRLQLRGKLGEVVGTDGRQLLLWGGFQFPFEDDVLVPAVPVFGGREFAGERDVRVGRTGAHVIVAAGPWTVWLAIDATMRYPDVATVVPRGPRGAMLLLDEADAVAVLHALPKAPGPGGDPAPVTLRFDARPSVGVEAAGPAPAADVRLSRSRCSGPATAVGIDARYLAWALSLGLREVRATAAGAAVLFRDEHRAYVVASLDRQPAPGAAGRPVPVPNQRTNPPTGEGEDGMNAQPNGPPPTDPGAAEDALDPLAEAEALRAALAEAARRVGRLMTSLRQFQKQRRALQAAWASLKHLRLGPKEGP
ncbi:MAG TPA: hypothetical protein VFE78_29900 [Gemmataceae bacterium]|nr:hypothetical protein [Gemmataceae bacterium]